MLSFTEFLNSVAKDAHPPVNVNVYLQALWYAKKGNWEKAHDLVQDIPGSHASWIHAYLHREEGDQWNADYWYNRAGKPSSRLSLEEEWNSIVQHLLEHHEL